MLFFLVCSLPFNIISFYERGYRGHITTDATVIKANFFFLGKIQNKKNYSKSCIECEKQRTKSEGGGEKVTRMLGDTDAKMICSDGGAWPVRHVYIRMKQHVYLVGSRNYSNFNNLSAARLPNEHTNQFWLADVGKWRNTGCCYYFYNLFTFFVLFRVSIYILANNILNQAAAAATTAADHVSILNRHFAYQCTVHDMYIFLLIRF